MNDFRVLLSSPHEVRCPHCGAGIYEWCSKADGRRVYTLLHASRRRAFVTARNRLRSAGMLIDEVPDA